MEPLLTPREIAAILKLSRSATYALLQRGRIQSIKVGHSVRVHPRDLEAFLEANRRAGGDAR